MDVDDDYPFWKHRDANFVRATKAGASVYTDWEGVARSLHPSSYLEPVAGLAGWGGAVTSESFANPSSYLASVARPAAGPPLRVIGANPAVQPPAAKPPVATPPVATPPGSPPPVATPPGSPPPGSPQVPSSRPGTRRVRQAAGTGTPGAYSPESRTFNFQDAAHAVRGALRPGAGQG